MKKLGILALLAMGCVSSPLLVTAQTYIPPASSRQDITLDANWRFLQQDVANAQNIGFDDSSWTNLNLPHTWDIPDGQDGPSTTYYQGTGWYRSHFTVAGTNAGLHFFLKFDGAFLVADVWVNGTFLGEHQGGFAAFVFDVTSNVVVGADNVIAVKLNNAVNGNIPPLTGDFTKWGGIYRDVHLLVTDPVQVSPLDYGSPGVYLMPANVSASSANLQVTTVLANTGPGATNVMLRTVITGAATNLVTTLTNFVTLPPGSGSNVVAGTIIANPHLWNGLSDPYLYQVFVEVWKGSNVADLVAQPLGFRFFSIDPTNGFFLNGAHYDLHGVSMHQDWLNCGWALTNAQRDTDFMFIKEIGATAVRLPHFQHNDYTYTLGDRNGVILWSEVPNIESVPGNYTNTLQQLRELIRQEFNHPSVVCWGMYNEIGAGNGSTNIIGQEVQVAHADDPTRPTTAASNVAENDPTTLLTDVICFNEYYGWYSTPIDGLAAWMDSTHAAYPARPTGLSEYGAGGSIYQHTENPVQPAATITNFHPEEWQNLVHETNWLIIKARPYLWTKFVWNLFDFASDSRAEGDTYGRNDKGLVTYDRKVRKDAFYFYKANWITNPMVYITGHTFTNRLTNYITAKVYANCDTVQLYLNGISQGAIADTNCIFTWPVTLTYGTNNVLAIGTKGGIQVTDSLFWVFPLPTVSLAASPGNTQVSVSWSAWPGVTGYVLQRSTTSGGPYSTVISTPNTSYLDAGLVNGTTYYYVVYFISPLYGQSPLSTEANATPLVSQPGVYWINPITSSPQSWDVNSNWSGGGAFPSGAQALAIVNTAISANQTINLNQAITVGTLNLGASGGAAAFNLTGNGGTLTFTNSPGSARLLQLTSSAGDTISAPLIFNVPLIVTNASTNPLALAGNISGTTNGLAISGNVVLNGTNTYSGGTIINSGTVQLNVGGNNNNLGIGSGAITFNGGALQLNGYAGAKSTYWGALSNDLVVPSGQTGALLCPPRINNGLLGKLTGGGILNLTVDYVRGSLNGDWSAFTGQINVIPNGTGDFRINNSYGYAKAAVYLNSGVNLYNINANNQTTDIGELGGASGAVIGGGSTGPIWRIGAKNTTNTFAGTIVNSGTTSLIKVGAGALILSGANTYSGATTVSNGTLLANNIVGSATGSGAVTVANGGTLGGNGIIFGAVTVSSGGVLAPGNPLGALTVSNNLTQAAGSTTFLQVQHSPLTNDAVNISGTLTSGGMLIVTNSGATALAAGDSFKLFNAAIYSGSFATLKLPPLPAGLGWNTNNLNIGGALSVVVTAKPVIGPFSIFGNAFVFAGTGGVANANFCLLGTTNLAGPLNNWTCLLTNQFDNSGNFNFTNALNPNWPQGFYLLQLP